MRPSPPPAWRALLVQVVVLGLLAGAVWWLGANTLRNLEQRHVSTGVAFLWRPSSLPIADALIDYDPTRDSFALALAIGFANTLLLSACVIVASTLAGTAVGLARLSPNGMASSLAALYVNVVRNVPALLVVLFVMSQMRHIGPPRQAIALPGGAFLSNRGLVLPSLTEGSGLAWALVSAAVAAALAGFWTRHRLRRGLWVAAAAVAAAALALALSPLHWHLQRPQLRGFNFVGGTVISLEFCAILVALSVYYTSYVAETVRSGVLAVPRGLWDAAHALGLSRWVTLRKVVAPLALRVIVPPLTNIWLGIVKASSLGIAIGYQELVSVVNTALSMTGQSIELVFILMLAYLSVSLAIGSITHGYNERLMRQGPV